MDLEVSYKEVASSISVKILLGWRKQEQLYNTDISGTNLKNANLLSTMPHVLEN